MEPGRKPFNPEHIPGCVNALGPNKDIDIQNLVSPSPTGNDEMVTQLQNLNQQTEEDIVPQDSFIFKVRERSKNDQMKSIIQGQEQNTSKGSRRTKERKIGEVIQKVQKWRNLYYKTGESLEEAAKKVGISKKSLDDYFLQLKNGKNTGFNFNEHKSDKIGILRNWNKHHKNDMNASAISKQDKPKSSINMSDKNSNSGKKGTGRSQKS